MRSRKEVERKCSVPRCRRGADLTYLGVDICAGCWDRFASQDDPDAVRKVLKLPVVEEHREDADCTVDPETLTCKVCGVDHSGGCPDCGGRGFHLPGCGQVEAVPQEVIDPRD